MNCQSLIYTCLTCSVILQGSCNERIEEITFASSYKLLLKELQKNRRGNHGKGGCPTRQGPALADQSGCLQLRGSRGRRGPTVLLWGRFARSGAIHHLVGIPFLVFQVAFFWGKINEFGRLFCVDILFVFILLFRGWETVCAYFKWKKYQIKKLGPLK